MSWSLSDWPTAALVLLFALVLVIPAIQRHRACLLFLTAVSFAPVLGAPRELIGLAALGGIAVIARGLTTGEFRFFKLNPSATEYVKGTRTSNKGAAHKGAAH